MPAPRSSTCQVLARTDNLYKAPEPTSLKKNSTVRVAWGAMRWYYGKVAKVLNGKELLDVDLDNGEQLRSTPLYDISIP